MTTEQVIDGEAMCECGHVKDEHTRRGWCLANMPNVDDCIEFRPAKETSQ